jgi:hypothetical protein
MYFNELPRCKQRGINRNIYNRPKGRGIKPLSSGGLNWQLKRSTAMIRITRQTRLKPTDIIDRASDFFGEGGEALEEKERNPCCISFEGAGGYVAVSVVDEDKHRMVDVESREFEYQVKRFLETL